MDLDEGNFEEKKQLNIGTTTIIGHQHIRPEADRPTEELMLLCLSISVLLSFVKRLQCDLGCPYPECKHSK